MCLLAMLEASATSPSAFKLIPSNRLLTNYSVGVPTAFKAVWNWTDGAPLGEVILWKQTSASRSNEIKHLSSAAHSELAATLESNSYYILQARNIGVGDRAWRRVSFGTAKAKAAWWPVTPPKITRQPNDNIVCQDATAMISVDATGDSLKYQWYFEDEPILNATSPIYRFVMSEESWGAYSVVVSNSAGEEGSDVAFQDIAYPTEIFEEPRPIAMKIDDDAFLFVGASGGTLDESPTYQWFKDGAMLPGATNQFLDFERLAKTDAGNYSATITARCGTSTSRIASVSVFGPGEFPSFSGNLPTLFQTMFGRDELNALPSGLLLSWLKEYPQGSNLGEWTLEQSEDLQNWFPTDESNAYSIGDPFEDLEHPAVLVPSEEFVWNENEIGDDGEPSGMWVSIEIGNTYYRLRRNE